MYDTDFLFVDSLADQKPVLYFGGRFKSFEANNKLYIAGFQKAVNQPTAVAQCKTYGAKLAEIYSDEELNALS